MIDTCNLYTVDLYGAEPAVRRALEKQYGSRRSGTIYIVAKGQGEANEVAREMFTRNGFVPPARLKTGQSDHVKQALRKVY